MDLVLGTHASANVSSLKGIGTSINLWTFLASIVPANIIKAFSDNNLLSVIFFAIVLGLGLGAYGPAKAKPLLNLFDIWIEALYKSLISLSSCHRLGFSASLPTMSAVLVPAS
ncbi:hypothetical protein S101258_00345 [Lactiplantibacillus plantarum subsp. plantarum]|uniref:Uncharacterized protein n=1 Tax=Lactiplantibacillus plantarum subsp. plantarum TaxID=337330 RepID=A0A2S3U9H2_LACPN|nr:hypothetical protein S101258_00345 [Lactiplantibacillus plantarum subsp. plantarum]